MLKKMTLICSLVALSAFSRVHAQEPPSPLEVANTVSNLWMGRDFEGLNTYITNLYTTHSNYVPATLAKSFHDGVFEGKLADATNKLHRVKAANLPVTNQTQEIFHDILLGEIDRTTSEIEHHLSLGRTLEQLEAHASPSEVRDVMEALDFDTIILFYAPATNVP